MRRDHKRDILFFGEYLGLLLFALVWVRMDHVRPRVGDNLGLFHAVILSGAAYVIVRGILVIHAKPKPFWEPLWLALDLLLIGAIVRLTGGIYSEAALVYFWPLATASIARSPVRTGVVGVAIAGLYMAATWPLEPVHAYWQILGVRMFVLALVTMLACAYAASEARRVDELARLRQQIAVADLRTRMSHEMYDVAQRQLQAIVADLEEAEGALGSSPEVARERIRAARSTAKEAAAGITDALSRLRSPGPGEEG